MVLTASSSPALFPHLLASSCGVRTFFVVPLSCLFCRHCSVGSSCLSGGTALNTGVHLMCSWEWGSQRPPTLPSWTRFTCVSFLILYSNPLGKKPGTPRIKLLALSHPVVNGCVGFQCRSPWHFLLSRASHTSVFPTDDLCVTHSPTLPGTLSSSCSPTSGKGISIHSGSMTQGSHVSICHFC